MARRMFRYSVPVTGSPVHVDLTGDPVAVGMLEGDRGVEFWVEDDDAKPRVSRVFTIAGTGHAIPDNAVYVGTAPRGASGLVWHLFEVKDSSGG